MSKLLLMAAAMAVATPAFAQSSADLPDPNDQSDSYTVGGGVAFVPDYEGSEDYRMIPAAAIRGRVNGISFSTRGTYLYVDLIRRGTGIDIDAGPIAGVRLNRTGKAKNDTVDYLNDLEDRRAAIELGGFVGVTAHGLTNPYDALSLRVDVVHGLNAHKSTLVTPTIEFSTPLSKTLYVGASASMEWAGGGYADYYFSNPAVLGGGGGGGEEGPVLAAISPQAIEAIPAYDADGGFKNWKLGLLVNQSLSGDLRKGLSLFAMGNIGRLSGDFARAPIVSELGSRHQKMGAIGLAYSW